MPRTIAIEDIHGCSKTFFSLLEKLEITGNDVLYLLSDYIDRGKTTGLSAVTAS